jgi:hypothetical protein
MTEASLFLETVGSTTALSSDIFTHLDVHSLGRVERACKDFQSSSLPAWKAQADRGLLPLAECFSSFAPKEQIRRFHVTRTYTEEMATEHFKHFAYEPFTFGPRRRLLLPQASPNCGGCNRFPNLQTSVLLAENVGQYDFFCRMEVSTEDNKTDPVVFEGFLKATTTQSSSTNKYVAYRLDLQTGGFDPERWPLLSGYMRGSLMEEENAGARDPMLFSMLSRFMLKDLDVTVTAVNRQGDGTPCLVLATGDGREGSSFLQWELMDRMVDCHPNHAASHLTMTPTLKSTIHFASDYSTLEALELRVEEA